MHDRTISVVIPTNRGGPYLHEAVESVRAQTRAVLEIILVDDGSPPPGLQSTATSLGITYLRQEASGISAARNFGVAMASGEWVTFLDDDDVWHAERIAAQCRALDDSPTAIACVTGGWYLDHEGRAFGEEWHAPHASADALIALDVMAPRVTTLTVRRDAYLQLGGCNSSLEPAEDNDLILRLLQVGEFAFADRPLVGYRRHDRNVTRRGLRGRRANRRSIVKAQRRAELAGDSEMGALLRRRQRTHRREAASQNLGELIEALRTRQWTYASQLSSWALVSAPVDTVRAVVARFVRLRRGR